MMRKHDVLLDQYYAILKHSCALGWMSYRAIFLVSYQHSRVIPTLSYSSSCANGQSTIYSIYEMEDGYERVRAISREGGLSSVALRNCWSIDSKKTFSLS